MDQSSEQLPRDSHPQTPPSEDSQTTLPLDDFLSQERKPQSDPEAQLRKKGTGPDPNAFPDGGFEAWLVVLGGFCAVFCSFGWINCIGVFQNYYEQNQLKNYSSSTIAWIPSTQSFMMFFPGIVAGRMTEELGPRIPLLLGSFMHIFGLMMISISKEYYQFFLSQSICNGIGCSFLFYPVLAVVGTWFLKHRALAFGIALSGSSLGGVVLPIMVQRLIPHIGFAWTMRALAFMLLGLIVFANLTIKSRLPPSRRPFALKDLITPYKEKPFFLLALAAFFINMGGFLPFNFLIAQAIASGMSPELAGYLVPITNAASTFGRILPAHLGDAIGVFNVMIVLSTFGAVMTLALWLPAASNAPIIIYAVMYGFASGCTLSIIPAMVAKLGHISQLGSRNGALYAFASFGALVGSPIGGAIQNRQHGSYSGLIVFTGVALMIGTVLVVFSRTSIVGLKLKVKI